MATLYPTPPGDGAEPIAAIVKDTRRQLRSAARPDGTRLASLVDQVQAALANLVATTISAVNTYLSTGTVSMASINASGNIAAAGNVTAGGNLNGVNSVLSGDLYSLHGHNTPVVSGYVAAYFNTDGRLGASVSARRFKQDIAPKTYTLDQIALIQIVSYRLRTAVKSIGDEARIEIGVIAEQLIDAGMPEFVVFDENGETFTVAYERLDLVGISGVQQLIAIVRDHEARLGGAGL